MGLIIVLVVAVVIVVVIRNVITVRGNKAIERFVLPEDSDKESFMDEKTGKRYDKEAYDQYLTATVKRLNDAQLKNLLQRRDVQTDIWNTLLCDAAEKELDCRQEAAAVREENLELEMAEISGHIAPFFWVEQDFGASVGLTTGEYRKELFAAHGLTGSPADWESLASAVIREQEIPGRLEFESQGDMFGVYAKDTVQLKQFIYAFHEVCEDQEALEALMSRVATAK